MRKMVYQFIGTRSSITAFQALQETEMKEFLIRVSRDPRNLSKYIRLYVTLLHVRRFSYQRQRTTSTQGAIFLRISHGYNIKKGTPDPLINLVETAAQDFYFATTKIWMVDIFPWCAFSNPADVLVPPSHAPSQCVTCHFGFHFSVLRQSIVRLIPIRRRSLTTL